MEGLGAGGGASGLDAEARAAAPGADRAITASLNAREEQPMLLGLSGYLVAALLLMGATKAAAPSPDAARDPGTEAAPTSQPAGSIHDFDFLVGRWTVK